MLSTQDQEEGERQDGYQCGDERGSASDHISGRQQEVTRCPPQLAANILDLVAEPLEHPTEPILPGEALEVFCRSFGSLRHGCYELDQALDLVDKQGQ